MLKRKHSITAAILGLSVMTAGIPAKAAQQEVSSYGSGVYIISGQEAIQKVKEQIENLGENVMVIDLTGNGLVDCEIPGWDAILKPEETPETNIPETDAPESSVPETNAPEEEFPEANEPETDVPETELPEPETSAPETNAPEEETPETNASETDTSESQQSYAMQVFDLVNKERAKEGLAALKYDEASAAAALVRAREAEISFSHTRPNGSSFNTALTESGASFRGAGENIAYGQRTPEEVVEGWMNSPGHRANILNKKYTKIGVGHYQNSKGVHYWAQLFTY